SCVRRRRPRTCDRRETAVRRKRERASSARGAARTTTRGVPIDQRRPASAYPLRRSAIEQQLALNPRNDLLQAAAGFEIGEDERTISTRLPRIARHHVEARAHAIREIDLVDDKQVGPRDPRSA